MDKIKSFFECLIPVTVCNLKCNYCYVIQRDRRDDNIPQLDYTPEQIGKALRKERLGGICYFSICGAGETLIPEYTIPIVKELLKNGHYVNITTNGTLSKRINEIADLPEEFLERLQIAFSLHYNELKRLNMVDSFFENVNKIKKKCSILVQLNLCDEYIPFIDEIKALCKEKIGAYPQIAATREEVSLTSKIKFMTRLSDEEYVKEGQKFNSPLFDFTIKNFNVKRREFCYAGDWTYTLNLQTGIMKRCYSSCVFQNIFKNINTPIRRLAVGNKCNSLFCLNSSHFLALGAIPEIKDCPSYVELRDRPEGMWYTSHMKNFLSGKLYENNCEYKQYKRILCSIVGSVDKIIYNNWNMISKRIRKRKKRDKR